MNSDTPETDAEFAEMVESTNSPIAKRLAKLERERDEERDTLTQIHRWIERNHPDGFIASFSHFKNLERVTDRWYERFDRLERERDEARGEAVRFRSLYYTQLGIGVSASWFPWEAKP